MDVCLKMEDVFNGMNLKVLLLGELELKVVTTELADE